MSIIHILLALLVVVIWGFNFIFVKLGLDEFSPLFLCALRFLFASVPAIFFIKPPAIPLKIVALYGIVMFAMQFAFLFLGMHVGITPGMSSLLMQAQIFFSMFFAAIVLDERPNSRQMLGALISFIGIGLVAVNFNSHISSIGIIFILAAAAMWGIGNLITKKMSHVNMTSLVIWGCFFACIPMLIITCIIEKPASIIYSLQHVTHVGGLSLFYIVCLSTWVGYGVWNNLISRYSVGTVVPFTLLVPIVGMLSSVFFLGEPLETWKVIAGGLVITGLYINIIGSRFFPAKSHFSSLIES
jgi:O-acetylserine/cysteine efflux transporter